MSDSQNPILVDEEAINSENSFRETIELIRIDLNRLEDELAHKAKQIEIPSEKGTSAFLRVNNIQGSISLLSESLRALKYDNDVVVSQAKRLILENKNKIKRINTWSDFTTFLNDFQNEIRLFQIIVSQRIQSEDFIQYKEMAQKTVESLKNRETQLKNQVEEVKTLVEQTKNLKIHDYYDLAAKENKEK
uniref:hypothetical protein n=1 Tax=Acinetobacter oleivorans TaxID=1148157 RepID=UPI0012501FA3